MRKSTNKSRKTRWFPSEESKYLEIPPSTPIPNFYFDEVMPYVSGETWKVLTFFARVTFGFGTDNARITQRQLRDGFITFDNWENRKEESHSGLEININTIQKAIKILTECKVLVIVDTNDPDENTGNLYLLELRREKLNLDILKRKEVQE